MGLSESRASSTSWIFHLTNPFRHQRHPFESIPAPTTPLATVPFFRDNQTQISLCSVELTLGTHHWWMAFAVSCLNMPMSMCPTCSSTNNFSETGTFRKVQQFRWRRGHYLRWLRDGKIIELNRVVLFLEEMSSTMIGRKVMMNPLMWQPPLPSGRFMIEFPTWIRSEWKPLKTLFLREIMAPKKEKNMVNPRLLVDFTMHPHRHDLIFQRRHHDARNPKVLREGLRRPRVQQVQIEGSEVVGPRKGHVS